MLISKFNKLIRNKIVWAAFAVIVSLSMVGFFAPQPRETRERRRDAMGVLFGEDISRDEFSRARLFAQSFQPLRGGEEVQRIVDDEAWRRLAALRYAEKLGIRVSSAELIQSIQNDPSFSENGTFSMQRYQFLIEQQLGIPVSWFEEYIRQEILLERMRDMLQSSLWIPVSELEENAARFTDTYEVLYVKVPLHMELTPAEVTDEDARRVYEDSPERFLVPEKRRVVYAVFPHARYLNADEISMRQIEMRYEADPDRFAYTDPETELEDIRPLDEVADEIRQELAVQEAEAMAAEAAMQLVDELSLLGAEAEDQLSVLAEQMGIGASTSKWLQAEGEIPEDISAGPAFVQAAFRLSPIDPEQSFSFSVAGTNAVYVMQLQELEEEYVPAFEDIRDDALAVARSDAEEAAYVAYVEGLHERLSRKLQEGNTFTAAAEATDLLVTEMKPFTLYDADPREIPFFGDLAPELLPLQTGEMTPPVRTVEGSVIAYVRNREAGSVQERLALKPDIARMMLGSLEQVHYHAWTDAILEEARK